MCHIPNIACRKNHRKAKTLADEEQDALVLRANRFAHPVAQLRG
jgi:hypothetical protein